MNSRNRWITLISFLVTLSVLLWVTHHFRGVELRFSEPLLEIRSEAATEAPSDFEAVVLERTEQLTAAVLDSDSRDSGDFGGFCSKERWGVAFEKMRLTDDAHRQRWLSDKGGFYDSDLIKQLLALGGGPEMVTYAIDQLSEETDPLVQAVLTYFLTVNEKDPRVLEALEAIAFATIQDSSRPVIGQLAVDGVLAAMGRHDVPPEAFFRSMADLTNDPIVFRDLWMGLSVHEFSYSEVQDLLSEGLSHDSKSARFGAMESLRIFALNDELSRESFVDQLMDVVAVEDVKQNQLLFLESIGAVGGEAGLVAMQQLVDSEDTDPTVRKLALINLACHGDPADSMAASDAAIASGDRSSALQAIEALGAVPDLGAVERLAELYRSSEDPALRAAALRSLIGKDGAPVAVFLDAGRSDDPSLRRKASEELMVAPVESMSEEEREQVGRWLIERSHFDDDAGVRTNAVMGDAILRGVAAVDSLRQSMTEDEAPEVRVAAAGALYLMGWARGDDELKSRVGAAIGAENRLVRREFERAVASLTLDGVDGMRSALRKNLDFLRVVKESSSETRPGRKDPVAREERFLRGMLALLGSETQDAPSDG